MKPDFTLSLSQVGIRLLHRTATGWKTVGVVDPAQRTLAEDLAALRQAALALDPKGDVCALAIPDTQIRYLTLPDTAGDETTRRDAARTALEGATPYPVSELVFDICADGDVTHVAAVARETLAEAEAFARDHQFTPTRFVGQVQAEGFTAEPHFGAPQTAQEIATPARDATVMDNAADADPKPTFVSRRRVPTFRTEAPEPEAKQLTGFAEQPARFTSAPKPPKTKRPAQSALPAPGPVVRKTKSEVERFTIFGARASNGLSGRMGAMGVAIIVCVALIAGLAAFAGSTIGTRITDLYARIIQPQPEAQFTSPLAPEPSTPIVETALPQVEPEPAQVAVVAPAPDLTDEDAAVLDALRAPEIPPDSLEAVPEPAVNPIPEAPAAPAPTGVRAQAPDVPRPPALIDLEDLYVTSIDPINPNFDAVALPALASRDHDAGYLAPASPAPAGTTFTLDARGLVVPSAAGALNADGVLVFAGPPPARPPLNLVKTEDPDVDLTDQLLLAGLRPRLRPDDLAETTERATLTGLTRSELGQIRPRLRPKSDQELARASASLVQLDGANSRSLLQQPNGTGSAVVASLRPDPRPDNFGETVAKARAKAPTAAPAPAPRLVTPKIPSTASASREATTKNAINLRRVNLIGVYGKPSSRRALVRLENGRYRKVEVGDNIDGGKVSAIGDTELRYQKRGRAIVLKMPRS